MVVILFGSVILAVILITILLAVQRKKLESKIKSTLPFDEQNRLPILFAQTTFTGYKQFGGSALKAVLYFD